MPNRSFYTMMGLVAAALYFLFTVSAEAKKPAPAKGKSTAGAQKTAPRNVAANPPTAPSPRFSDSLRGFGITLPAGWEQQKDSMGAVIMALSPQESAADKFRENINVVVESLPEPMATKDYFSASQNVIKKVFTDFKLEKTGVSKIDKQEFYWSLFTHRLGNIKAKVLQYVGVHDRRAYVITCSAEPDRYKAYETRFESSVKSFTFEAPTNRNVTSKKK